jgi:internalin A
VKTLAKLEMLSLEGTSVTSDGVAHLAALPNLRSIWLRHSAVNDNAVKAFVNIKSLVELNLEDAQLSGAGLMDLRTQLPNCLVYCDMVNLQGSDLPQSQTGWQKMVTRLQSLNQENRLKLLDASNPKIGDEHLRDFYQLNNLQAINLQNTAVTQPGVDKLKKALPRCTCRY